MTLVACISGLFITLPIWVANISVSKLTQPKQLPTQISVEQLQQQAQAITVKVMSSDVLGTGIILQKQGSVYTVITNAHVLRAGNPPDRIQTGVRHIWQNVETLQLGDKQGGIADFQKAADLYRQQGNTQFYQEAQDLIRQLQ